MATRQSISFGWLGCAIALALLAVESWSLRGVQGSDFRVFTRAVARVLADPATLYGNALGPDGSAVTLQGFLYPPPSILLLWPFGALPADTGFALLSWGSLLCVIGALWLWLRICGQGDRITLPRSAIAAIILLAAASGPVFSNRLGQVDALMMAISVAALVCANRRRGAWGGALLAIGGWVKIYPGLLMAPLLLRRQQPVALLGGFALAAGVMAAATMLIIPSAVWHSYFFEQLPVMSARAIVNIYNQSLTADVLRLTLPQHITEQTFAAELVPLWLRIGSLLTGLALMASAYLATRRTPPHDRVVEAVTLATIALIAPLGWGHTYVFVLPLWALVMATALSRDHWGLAGLAFACWAALLIPAHRQFAFLDTAPHALWWMVHSRYALATLALIVMAVVQARSKTAAIPCPPPMHMVSSA